MAGEFLSSFAEHFLRARGIEEARSRAAGAEAAQLFDTERYLEELGREREAREEALPEILAQQRLRGLPAVRTPAPPGATYEGLPNPEAPPIPAGGSLPLAAGGVAALGQPPRPPVPETLLGALTPQKQARFLTSRTGRAIMPTLEASERERRQEEDREHAETFFAQGQESLRGGDTAGGLDHFAAGLRRLGRYGDMTQYMHLAAKTRADKQEEERAAQDAKAVIPALDAFDRDPTAATLAAVSTAQANVTSLAWKKVSADMVQNRLKKALSGDRDEEAFLRAAVTSDQPPEHAWAAAAKQYPQGLFKIMSRQLLSGKAELPEELWDVMRLTKPAGKDASLALRARMQTLLDANAARRAGAPWTPMQFQQRWNDTILELERAEAQAKKTPEERQAAQDRAEITRLRLEALKKPESLAGKTSEQLTLLIQRTTRDLEGDLSPEEERDAKDYLRLLRRTRDEKLRAPGSPTPPAVPAGTKDKRAQRPPETPTVEGAKAELRRLIGAGHTMESAKAAMRQVGWQ